MSAPVVVLLDVDGTLVNTIDLGVRTLREALLKVTGAAPPEPDLRRAMHLPTLDTAHHFHPADPERLLAVWTGAFHTRFGENHLYPGVTEGLAILKATGFRLAAVTSETRPELEHTLRFFGLSPFFAVTVAVDEVPRRKPAPDSLLRALTLLGVPPEAALYLGDSPTDVQAARAAGVTNAVALWGGQPRAALLAEKPDHAFPSFAAFVDWLARQPRLDAFGRPDCCKCPRKVI